MALINEVIEGLQILKKYAGENSSSIDAQHDVIYAGPSLDELEGRLTEEDRKRLDELGWHEDTEGECWARFT
jgi:hypothetical protein